MAEKASQVKFSGVTSGNPALGAFLALETLSLGVEGKIALWRSLKAIGGSDPAFAGMNFDELIERGEAQRRALEVLRAAEADLGGDTPLGRPFGAAADELRRGLGKEPAES